MIKIIFIIILLLVTSLNAENHWLDKYINSNKNEYIDKNKYIKIRIKEQCHVVGNYYFSHNLFSPRINKQYDLLLDTRDVLYPEKINYIEFEPFGWTHYGYKYNNEYNQGDGDIFRINDDNIIHFNYVMHIPNNGHLGIENINTKRIKQIVKSDLQVKINGYNTLISYNGNLKAEEKKCNTKIPKQLNEKMIKDIISTIIFILLFLSVIFILYVLKNKFFNKKKSS